MSKRWLVAMSAMAQMACCIARGSKVKTPGGSRLIEELAVGDEVVAVDPMTNDQHVGRITAIRSAKRECALINALKLTSAHPLFDTHKNEWAPAGDWILGARTEFASIDGPQTVALTERFVGVDEVFDLSVDHPLHTFVVDRVVVHNKQPLGQQRCEFEDGRIAIEGSACFCGDEPSSVVCTSLVAKCDCPPVEPWSTDIRDGNTWSVVACGATPLGLSTYANSLRVESGPEKCGYLSSVATMSAARFEVRFMQGARDGLPLIGMSLASQAPLVMFGATDVDGGVQLIIEGTSADEVKRFTSVDTLEWDHWYVLDSVVEANRIRSTVFDRDTGEAVFDDTSFVSSDGLSIVDWQTNGGRFDDAAFNTRRVMIGTPISVGAAVTFVKVAR